MRIASVIKHQTFRRRKCCFLKYILTVFLFLGMFILILSAKFSNSVVIHLDQFIHLPSGFPGGLPEIANSFRISQKLKNIKLKQIPNNNNKYDDISRNITGQSSKQDCIKETKMKLFGNGGSNSSTLYDSNSEEIHTYINGYCNNMMKNCEPTSLKGRLKVNLDEVPTNSLQNLESFKNVKTGGWWHPKDCTSERNVAIIVPFKNRESQLQIFLRHYHAILQRQCLHYRIFVIEQVDQHRFNRGKLMNVGYNETLKYFPYDCFIFHDVDLLLEDDRLIYGCGSSPEHLSVGLDKYNYRLLYEELFGGIEMFTREHYKLVNGFSNVFWGWGAEDDNLYRRLRWKGLSLWRPSVHIARYTMAKHQDLEGSANKLRFDIRKESYKHFATDGLVNLQYEVKDTQQLFACTRIQVDLRKDRDKMFGVKDFPK